MAKERRCGGERGREEEVEVFVGERRSLIRRWRGKWAGKYRRLKKGSENEGGLRWRGGEKWKSRKKRVGRRRSKNREGDPQEPRSPPRTITPRKCLIIPPA